jgi:hypothetical protein
MLLGNGIHYDLTLTELGPVAKVPLDGVLALESFQNTTEKGLTVLASTGTTVLTVAAVVVLVKALFGSCPTVYSESDDHPELESELFSYSIAPMFEMQDIDRLRVQPDQDGMLQLEVRNEALETHYLNHLELMEVRHFSDEIVVPDENGSPVALKTFSSPQEIFDRTGRNLLPALNAADGLVFRTDPTMLDNIKIEDLRDSIEMRLPKPAGRDTVALVFRLRNSLLNTVLLYDMMLAASGARSLDWLGKELGEIRPALELASWYSSRMGMRVELWENGGYRQVARVPDTGPIAWKDLSVIVPVPAGDRFRVRLSFVADNWRIDQLRVATDVRRPVMRSIPLKEVVLNDGVRDASAAHSLESADQRYLQTSPGQSFRVRFDAGREPVGTSRTFLLTSRGYYTEWIRRSWIQNASHSGTFTPSDEALLQAIVRWRKVQPEFEARFNATRIPVR